MYGCRAQGYRVEGLGKDLQSLHIQHSGYSVLTASGTPKVCQKPNLKLVSLCDFWGVVPWLVGACGIVLTRMRSQQHTQNTLLLGIGVTNFLGNPKALSRPVRAKKSFSQSTLCIDPLQF